MANRSGRGGNDYSPPVFVDLTLSKEQLEKFDQWVTEVEVELDAYLGQLVLSGWKLSCRHDDNNHCAIASSTLWNPGDQNHNVCVSSRAATALEAVWMAIFKVLVLYEGVALKDLDMRQRFG